MCIAQLGSALIVVKHFKIVKKYNLEQYVLRFLKSTRKKKVAKVAAGEGGGGP